MPNIPGPPDDYSDEKKQAWMEGATSVLEILRVQNRIIENAYKDEIEDDSDDCDECGGPLIEGFGGPICPECEL